MRLVCPALPHQLPPGRQLSRAQTACYPLRVQVRRLLLADGQPVVLDDIWLPGQQFKGLTAVRLSDYRGPMYALFETEFGVRMVRAQEKIRAVLPDATQCALLRITSHTPLLSVERIAYTYNDTPMELRRGLYLTDTDYYRNELS